MEGGRHLKGPKLCRTKTQAETETCDLATVQRERAYNEEDCYDEVWTELSTHHSMFYVKKISSTELNVPPSHWSHYQIPLFCYHYQISMLCLWGSLIANTVCTPCHLSIIPGQETKSNPFPPHIKSPTRYQLSKYLAGLLKPRVGKAESHVQNSGELLESRYLGVSSYWSFGEPGYCIPLHQCSSCSLVIPFGPSVSSCDNQDLWICFKIYLLQLQRGYFMNKWSHGVSSAAGINQCLYENVWTTSLGAAPTPLKPLFYRRYIDALLVCQHG